MVRTRGKWVRTRVAFAIVLIVGGGLVLWHAPRITRGEGTDGNETAKSSPSVEGEADLKGDLDEAIRVVEAGEFLTFLEVFAPVEVLRRMRQEDLVERAARVLAERPQTKVQLLAVLRALKKQPPRFDKSRGLATLEFDSFESSTPEISDEMRPPDVAGLKLTGLGDDLPKVLSEAIRLLEEDEISEFVDRLFPATELARLKNDGQREALLQQFEEMPELSAAILADFKQMQPLVPEYTDNGLVAVFRFKKQADQPVRTIKLEKVGRDWRLFDDAPRVSAELLRQAKLKRQQFVTSVQMEHVGGNWRFIELRLLDDANLEVGP